MLIIFYINYSTTNVIVVFEAEVGAAVDFLIIYVVQLSPLTTVSAVNVHTLTFPLPNNEFQFTVFILVQLTRVACTAMFHVHNTLVLFIVFILVPLTRLSCFVLS